MYYLGGVFKRISPKPFSLPKIILLPSDTYIGKIRSKNVRLQATLTAFLTWTKYTNKKTV